MSTYIVPNRLWVGLHALGCLAHLFVEDGAVFRVDDILENYKTISVEGDDGCSNVLFGHTTSDAFVVGDADGHRVLELKRWRTHGTHDAVCC